MVSKAKPLTVLEEPTPINGAVPRGYLAAARPRYRWVTCPWTETADASRQDPDDEPFRAEIRTNLTWGEIDSFTFSGDLTFTDLWRIAAPFVRSWNALGTDAVTGEVVPIPPPSEAGPEAFQAIDADLTLWLAGAIKSAHLGGDDRGKG